MSSAIIAVTRKHMNLEIVWNEEMTMLTSLRFSQIKEVFAFVDSRYAKNFPDSVAGQLKLTKGRQKLESLPSDKLKSAEMLSSAKVTSGGSATTQPYTQHMNSGASH